MSFFSFVFIIVIALALGLVVYLYSKYTRTQKQLSQLQADNSKVKLSPVPGFSQDVWNELSTQMIDSNDNMLLLFDDQLRLRLWNQSAKTVFQFEPGIKLEEMEEAIGLMKDLSFSELSNQLLQSPQTVKEEGVLSSDNQKRIEFNLSPLVNEAGTLQALGMELKEVVLNNSKGPQSSLPVINQIGEPIFEMKLLNKDMGNLLNKAGIEDPNIGRVHRDQTDLIESVDSLLSYYKNQNSNIDQTESVESYTANTLVKSMSMIFMSVDLNRSVQVEKKIELSDCRLLLQAQNFQKIFVAFIAEVFKVVGNPRADASIEISWTEAPMDISLNFCIRLELLGQSIGVQWMRSLLEARKLFIDFETKMASLSCGMKPPRKEGDCLYLEIVIPRDLAN